ncbi:lytic transglycosylase domain-containing protein [Achromobacter spanius]|uniref:lytic transglycosylase domain-containing protein n=1 Tax=Achromobacter spanius TaxID=217203 RepID=UPI0037F20B9C
MIPFADLAQECAPDIAPETLQVVVKQESAFNPFAIGVNGGQLERQPASKDEAIATANALLKAGYSIDLGYGQINSANLPRLGLSVEAAFDGCTNLAMSAAILRGNYERALKQYAGQQEALRAALSMYNTGSFTAGITNGYVGKLLAHAETGQGTKVPAIEATPIPLKAKASTQRQPRASDHNARSPSGGRVQSPPANQNTNSENPQSKGDGVMVYDEVEEGANVMVYPLTRGESRRPPGRH